MPNAQRRPVAETSDPVKLRYRNWKGETRIREVRICYTAFAGTEYHPEPQWIVVVYDTEKKDLRYFALKDCDFLTPTMDTEEKIQTEPK